MKKYKKWTADFGTYVTFMDGDKAHCRRLYKDRNGKYIRFRNRKVTINDDEIYNLGYVR